MLTNREKLTAQAQRFVEKGQYEKAIREYLKVVAEDEKDVRTWLKIGDLFVKLGQKPQAAQTYQKVARFYADQGFYLKAVAVYKQILKIDPRLIDVNLALAELYQQLGLTPDAIQQYEAVAAFLLREGRGRDAIAAHRAAIDLDPDNVALRIKLAELYSKEGMAKEAAREFRHAGEQLRALGRTSDFLKVGERLLFHDPEDMAVAKELATLYLERGDARRALTKLQLAFKADPRDPATLEMLAQAFLALGQHQKSISVLKELGRVLMEGGQREEALAAYRRILDLDPQDSDARAVLSASQPALLALGQPAAGQTSGRSPSPAPTDEDVARTVTEADVYAKYGLYRKSIEHLQRALLRQPQSRLVRERLYALYETVGQTEAAITELWTLFAMATTMEEAASCLSEILRLDPQNKTALHRWQEMRGRPGTGAPSSPVPGGLSEMPSGPTAVDGPAGVGAAAPPAEALQDEIDEVDFFLRQSMHQEARLLLEALLQRYPDSDLVRSRMAALPPPETPSVELVVGADTAEEAVGGPAFEMTRQGLRERGASRSTSSSYFDLGVAYRDMGLYADAVAELRKALPDKRREAQCRTLIAQCLLAQDLYEEAVAELKQALDAHGLTESQRVEVYYHLGRCHEQMANREESIYFYEMTLKHDVNFRDTRERVALLRRQVPG